MYRTSFLLGILLILISCTRNEAPQCHFVLPVSEAFLHQTDTVEVSVNASDPDGMITEVRLFLNDIGLVSLTEWPYNAMISPEKLNTGMNTLKAIAYDDEMAEGSAEIQVSIGSKPVVTTNPVLDIEGTSATLSGTLVAGTGSVETGFYYSTTPDSEMTGSKLPVVLAGNKFTASLNGLNAGIRYYARAYGVSQYGDTLGEEISFETIVKSVPEVGATAISQLSSSSAAARAAISFDGNSNVTSRGFCWNTEGDPDLSDAISDNGIGEGSFSSLLPELTENTTYYVRAYATNGVGTSFGPITEFTTPFPDPETVTDIDGNIYNTVRVGTQLWMKENLATQKYNDGMDILHVTDNGDWRITNDGAYCWYNNDEANKAIYGGLYNFAAVESGKLCPSGWHVPSDDEWIILEIYLGMYTRQANEEGLRGHSGGLMKEGGTAFWLTPNNGATNQSGLSFRGAGSREENGAFMYLKSQAGFWTSTATSASRAWDRELYHDEVYVRRTNENNELGHSIRCIKDE